MESMIPNAFFQDGWLVGICLRLGAQPVDQQKFTGGGCGGLDLVEMLRVMTKQFPKSRQFLGCQPLLIVILVPLKRLTGIKRHQMQFLRAAEKIGQRHDPATDPVLGHNGQVVWFKQIKDQLTGCRFQAMFGELVYPHELPCGLVLPQLFFLFSIHAPCLHS